MNFSVAKRQRRHIIPSRPPYDIVREVFDLFCPWCFFISPSYHISELPLSIVVKLCRMIGHWLNFVMQVQFLGGGAHAPKNGGQNFCRFYTTSDFDREYLRNRSRYPKSESKLIENNSSCVLWKRSGELWSTNCWELVVRNDPLNALFWETIFRPLEGATPSNLYTR